MNPDWIQQGQALYEAGQLTDAADILQQGATHYGQQGDVLRQAVALSNLSLVYQQLERWTDAETAIATGITLLESQTDNAAQLALAQAFDIQGKLQFTRGQNQSAYETWDRAIALYGQLGEPDRQLRSQLNQIQALGGLGFHRRSLALLTTLNETLDDSIDATLKASFLRHYGDALQVAGQLDQALDILSQSLAIAQGLEDADAISAAQFSLGNVHRALGNVQSAAQFYQQSAINSLTLLARVQAQLNLLSLLIDVDQLETANTLVGQITPLIDQLPKTHAGIYARLNLAQSLMSLMQANAGGSDQIAIAQLLVNAAADSEDLADLRTTSYALGYLGNLYEENQQWLNAQDLTQQALVIAQSLNTSEVIYLWQWQLGRIYKAQDSNDLAIQSYTDAINTLQALRSDLVATNAEVQVSFQDSVEPIHRELVSLLTNPNDPNSDDPDRLEAARVITESLQLAELDNFLREACLDTKPIQIDEVDPTAAVIYPIILPDRLEVILSLPQQPLRHYSVALSQTEVENTLTSFRQSLTNRISRQFVPLSQQIYDWLIRPVEDDLAETGVKTLVFVPDTVFRNVPMAALFDGEQYLVQKYAVAITPGLQLVEPRPIVQQDLNVLSAGLTEARQGFSALPNIETELEEIEQQVPTRVLLNAAFTRSSFQEAANSSPFPIIHLATHGQFSSNLDETFILTWDDRISLNQLSSILQTSDLRRSNPIELLVLSACETANGDKRAALGLAGIAVRAGARSTVAALWQVDDEATALLMSELYKNLSAGNTTRADALSQAQRIMLEHPRFKQHPYFWSPFVLVGNWL
jgi:CHAT domain-containing protein